MRHRLIEAALLGAVVVLAGGCGDTFLDVESEEPQEVVKKQVYDEANLDGVSSSAEVSFPQPDIVLSPESPVEKEKPPPGKLENIVRQEVASCKTRIEQVLKGLDGKASKCGVVTVKGIKVDFASETTSLVSGNGGKSAVMFEGNADQFCLSRFMTRAISSAKIFPFWKFVSPSKIQKYPCRQLLFIVEQKVPVPDESQWKLDSPQVFTMLENVVRIIGYCHDRGVSCELAIYAVGSTDQIQLETFSWLADERTDVVDREVKGGLEVVVDLIRRYKFVGGKYRKVSKADHFLQFLDDVARFDFVGGRDKFNFEKWITIFSKLGKKELFIHNDSISRFVLRDSSAAQGWWSNRLKCEEARKKVAEIKSCVDLQKTCGTGFNFKHSTMEDPVVVGDLVQSAARSLGFLYSTSVTSLLLKLNTAGTGSDCIEPVVKLCTELSTLEALKGLSGKAPAVMDLGQESIDKVCRSMSLLLTRIPGQSAETWLPDHSDNPVKVLRYLIKTFTILEELHSMGFVHNDANLSNILVSQDTVGMVGFANATPFVDEQGHAVMSPDNLSPMKSDLLSVLHGVENVMGELAERFECVKEFYREIYKLGMMEFPKYALLISLLQEAIKQMEV